MTPIDLAKLSYELSKAQIEWTYAMAMQLDCSIGRQAALASRRDEALAEIDAIFARIQGSSPK